MLILAADTAVPAVAVMPMLAVVLPRLLKPPELPALLQSELPAELLDIIPVTVLRSGQLFPELIVQLL